MLFRRNASVYPPHWIPSERFRLKSNHPALAFFNEVFMNLPTTFLAWTTSALLIFSPLEMAGCGSKAQDPAPAAQQFSQSAAAGQDQQAAQAPAAGSDQQGAQAPAAAANQEQTQLPAVNLTAEGLDELMAPIALYPDPVLAVMLQAAVNPQEVMDGGNWLALDQNSNLKEAALDQASSKAGFTPVMQALLHYPTVVDLMCTQFDWTKQLGAAYQADPKTVLASAQRLRAQAVDNGALKSSPQMKVDVTQDQGQQVVELKPTDPKVVYIPQYDPSKVDTTTTTTTNADGSSTTTTTTSGPASAATSTNNTTVVQEKSGVSTGTAVLIGLLSFGAGVAVGAAISNNNYYYPAWGHGGVWYGPRPYFPPPYHPYYYGGWGGGYHYNRPPVYVHNNVNINVNNNYYNRFNNNGNLNPGYKPRPVPYNNNPNGTLANNMGNRPANKSGVNYKPNNTASTRPATGNIGGATQRPATGNVGGATKRPATGNNANNWKGQSTYQGNKNIENRPSTMPGNTGAGGMNKVGGNQPSRTPSGDRGYPNNGGARPNTSNAQARPSTGNAPSTRPATGGSQTSRPSTGNQPAARPATQPANRPQSNNGGAFGGANNPKTDRAASNRGHASMGATHSGGGRKK
jgi:hypothetical protein